VFLQPHEWGWKNPSAAHDAESVEEGGVIDAGLAGCLSEVDL
jgi:hypothetical protein